MDIISHGLWTGLIYKLFNRFKNRRFNINLAAFWGIFPDVFAFTILFVSLLTNILFGFLGFSEFLSLKDIEPAAINTSLLSKLTSFLYSISHSIVIFIIVFLLILIFRKKPYWELGGWLLHIIIDIPTHSYKFYPTPFLWPISGWKFDGLSWADPWFMLFNYAAIIIVYVLLKMSPKAITKTLFRS